MHGFAARRLFSLLWFLAIVLLLLPLFATLAQRPFSSEALQHFSEPWLILGRRFTKEAMTVATLQALASLAALLWLCFSATGARLLVWLEGLGRGRLWRELLCVAAGITLLTSLVELPFAYYLGFAHEQAYGLSKESALHWLQDHLLSSLLDLAMGMLIWIPLYWLIQRHPRGWWAPGALLQFAFSGLLIMLYPILLMPIFNEIIPVRDPQVEATVQRLAEQAGVRVESVREMLVSKETSRVNAMVTGLGMTKQVIVYDTLLQQFQPAEVEVVLAHELAHAAHGDVLSGWLLSGAGAAITLFLAGWMLGAMVGAGPLDLPAPHGARGLALLLLMLTLMGRVTAPVENTFSRRMEVRADRFALDVTGNPDAFVSGFRKLAGGNPGDVDPPAIVEFLGHSHPSIIERIQTAERYSRQ